MVDSSDISSAKGNMHTVVLDLQQGTELDFFEIVFLVKSQPEPLIREDGKIVLKCIYF